MQPLAPLVPEQLRAPVQTIIHKVEIWDGAAWRNLSSLGGINYVKSVSISLAAAGLSPLPISATWSAVLYNENSIFHPEHPASAWAGLLRVGREVRIWVGGIYDGAPWYRQRLIGFMDAPRFDLTKRTVTISGMDYSQLLTSKYLGFQRVAIESGSDSSIGPFVNVMGPTHWGSYIDLDTVESSKVLGAEIYAENDAAEIGAGEANNAANWDSEDGLAFSIADAGAGSTWALQFDKDGDASNPNLNSKNWNDDVGAVVAGTEYFVTFWYRRFDSALGKARMNFVACKTGTEDVFGGLAELTEDAWTKVSFFFTATETTNLKLLATIRGPAKQEASFRIDQISIKAVASFFNKRYVLPDSCNGPYLVTLNGEPVWQGFDEGGGWHYAESGRIFWLDDTIVIEAGSANLRIYYYTDQVPENVVADLLVHAGLYASRAAALADLNFTATGIVIGRVWFDATNTIMMAVAKLCERLDYRYWFAFDGQPFFHPAPVAGVPVFSFTQPGHVGGITEFQDRDLIQNHVVIEGIQLSMYPVSREDKTSDRLKAEARDEVSIVTYLEHSKTIQNHLFQNQASADAMAQALVDEFKEPRWASQVDIFANPVPLEVGDTVQWEAELEPATRADSPAGRVLVTMAGIIRDIKLNDNKAVYKVERCSVPSVSASPSVSESASESPSASPSVSESESGSGSESISASGGESMSMSGSMTEEIYDFYMGENFDWEVPSGVIEMELEGWGHGGGGGPRGMIGSFLGGGGGGGGAYSKKNKFAVTPGESLRVITGMAGSYIDIDTEIWRNYGEVDAACLLRAKYGVTPGGEESGAGGLAADGIGDVKYSGGYGAATNDTSGGGGGSSAGPSQNGTPTITRDGAPPVSGGGAGGDGGFVDENGSDGTAPGGGGGGSGYGTIGAPGGGGGGQGKVILRYWG